MGSFFNRVYGKQNMVFQESHVTISDVILKWHKLNVSNIARLILA